MIKVNSCLVIIINLFCVIRCFFILGVDIFDRYVGIIMEVLFIVSLSRIWEMIINSVFGVRE